MTGNRKVLIYAGIVSLLALAISVPKFFEYDTNYNPKDISKNKGYQAGKSILQQHNKHLNLLKNLSYLFELMSSY